MKWLVIDCGNSIQCIGQAGNTTALSRCQLSLLPKHLQIDTAFLSWYQMETEKMVDWWAWHKSKASKGGKGFASSKQWWGEALIIWVTRRIPGEYLPLPHQPHLTPPTPQHPPRPNIGRPQIRSQLTITLGGPLPGAPAASRLKLMRWNLKGFDNFL